MQSDFHRERRARHQAAVDAINSGTVTGTPEEFCVLIKTYEHALDDYDRGFCATAFCTSLIDDRAANRFRSELPRMRANYLKMIKLSGKKSAR
jgi:hypothetical protein